jgi:hypothetical protein
LADGQLRSFKQTPAVVERRLGGNPARPVSIDLFSDPSHYAALVGHSRQKSDRNNATKETPHDGTS